MTVICRFMCKQIMTDPPKFLGLFLWVFIDDKEPKEGLA